MVHITVIIKILLHAMKYTLYSTWCNFNSVNPGRFERNFIQAIFKLTWVINCWAISCETAMRWMSLDLSGDKSALVQVMVWRLQATSHYMGQCLPRSMSLYVYSIYVYSITRFQWVNHGMIQYRTSIFTWYIWCFLFQCWNMHSTK